MNEVTSKDGTVIAYTRGGDGPGGGAGRWRSR